nr:rhabdomeric opsin [Batillipes sp.]
MIIGAFFFPLFIITFCYYQIYTIVKKSNNSSKLFIFSTSSEMQKIEKQRKEEINLAKSFFVYVCGWFIAWTPYCICAMLPLLGQENYLSPWMVQAAALSAKTSAVYNPVCNILCVHNLNTSRMFFFFSRLSTLF